MWVTLLLISLFLFAFGAMIGSFLNVVIYRSVKGESWVAGRSKCEHCNKQIRWYDNVPLLSFMLLKGKCRWCKTPISITHPVVEFLTGTLLVWWYLGGTFFFRLTQQPFHYVQPLFWLIVGFLLVFIFVADTLYMIIPDEAVGVLLFLTLLYRISLSLSGVMQPLDFVKTILGAMICGGFFFFLWWITKGKGMGLGDVKFAVPFALLLGWPNFIIGVFVSFLLGAGVAVVLLLLKKKKMKQVIPFGPFLVMGLVLTLVWGSNMLHWYLQYL